MGYLKLFFAFSSLFLVADVSSAKTICEVMFSEPFPKAQMDQIFLRDPLSVSFYDPIANQGIAIIKGPRIWSDADRAAIQAVLNSHPPLRNTATGKLVRPQFHISKNDGDFRMDGPYVGQRGLTQAQFRGLIGYLDWAETKLNYGIADPNKKWNLQGAVIRTEISPPVNNFDDAQPGEFFSHWAIETFWDAVRVLDKSTICRCSRYLT